MLTKVAERILKMIINSSPIIPLNEQVQQEMLSLIKHLANCEPFELEGLKVRAGRLIENLRKGI